MTLQPGDRVRIITWYCGVLARSNVGQVARVQRIGYNGSYLVACRAWDLPRWVSPAVAARCLERVES
jgi:hypothetical protein